MPDAANTKWLSALEVLSSSGELGQGKMSMIRMTHLIDVDGTLVLVVGSAFAKDIVEQARGPISAAAAMATPPSVAAARQQQLEDCLLYTSDAADE